MWPMMGFVCTFYFTNWMYAIDLNYALKLVDLQKLESPFDNKCCKQMLEAT